MKPLVVWAAHFFASYAALALFCQRGLPGLKALLLALSALAATLLALMAWRAWRALRAAPASTRCAVRFGAAVLALVAVAWATLPVPLLPACADPAVSSAAGRRGSRGGRR